MSTEVHSLGRAAVYEEPNGSFAVDHSGTPGDFLDVPLQEGSADLTLTRTQLEPETIQQYIDAYPDTVLGVKRATLSFSIVLAATGVAADENTNTVDEDGSALLRILKATYGGITSAAQGSTVSAVTSTTSFAVASGDGSNFTVGGALVLKSGASNAAEAREIEAISTDAVTLKHAVTNQPSVGDDVYNTTTIYPTEDPDTSLQFIVEGVESDDRWVLRGGQLQSISINLPMDELPTLDFEFEFATWDSLSSASITEATYTNFEPIHVFGEFFAQKAGTSTKNLVQISEIGIENALSFARVTSPHGTENIQRYRKRRNVPLLTVNFTTLFEDSTWFDARDNQDEYHLQFQLGNEAGKIVLITIPTAQITDAQRVDSEDLAAQQVEARSQLDRGISSPSSEIQRAVHRLHFG